VSFDTTENLDAVVGLGPERGAWVMRVLECGVTNEIPRGPGLQRTALDSQGEGQDDRPDRRGAVLRGRSSRPASGYEHYPHSGTIRNASDLKHPHCAFQIPTIPR
jgi:hypothetical protein